MTGKVEQEKKWDSEEEKWEKEQKKMQIRWDEKTCKAHLLVGSLEDGEEFQV